MVSTVYPAGHSSGAVPEDSAADPRPKRLTRQQQDALIAWVQVWHDAGCAVHPSKIDGSKYAIAVRHGSPDIQPDTFPATYPSGPWQGSPHPRAGQPNPEAGQHAWGWGRIKDGAMPPLTVDQVAAYIRSGKSDGIGVICGRVSGGVFMLEAEGRARDLLPKVREAAERLGTLPLLERLAAGCVDESPSGGLHFYLRSDDGTGPGNVLLAARPDPAAEHGRQVLFETRGHGGWSVVAPSAGRTHKTGKPYRFVRGGPSTIPTFTQEEIGRLFDTFRAVDEMPVPEPTAVQPSQVARRERPAGDILPGEDFNQRATWEEILTDWKRGQVVGDRQHWTRPGKAHGTSATTTADVLCCYSSSAGLPVFTGTGCKNALSKFATYAHLNHGGDFAAAARDLWNRGYGSRAHDDDRGDGGQPVAPPEPRPEPTGPCRTLDDWRQEATDRRIAAVQQPGLYLDRSPTGSGKTHATIEALSRASSFLVVMPTHANVVEVVQEMRGRCIDVVAYPELTADNCQQFDTARRAQSLGLVAGAAVCPTCPFKDGCTYRAAVKAAEKSPGRACTAERLRRSSKAAEGVEVVVIDELPEAAVAPTLNVTVGELGAVDHLAHGIQHYFHSEADPDQKSFARAMQAVVATIHAACRDITTAGTRLVDLHLGHDVPSNWQRLLMDSIHRVGVGHNLNADALALVTRAAAGELSRLEIVTDLTVRGRLVHFVVGSWRPALPAEASVIMLDATAVPEDVAAAVGQPVVDCTPVGHLPLMQTVVQVPVDISRSTAPSTVAGYIEAFLADHPEVQRLGIIGHKPHLLPLLADGLLASAARERVAKWCWFGQGPDRGSNTWHVECDYLLVLGTPRANPGDYRRWLPQHGLHDAAGRPDGDWGPRDWEAVTVDGQQTVVHGQGYRDPDWHRAFVAVCRSTMHQSVGRGRPILPEGIPVALMSCEPTPYPIAPSLSPLPAAVRETVDIIRRMGTLPAAPAGLLECAKTPIGNTYRENCASGPWRTRDCIRAICAAAGIDRRAAEVRLADCKAAGLLVSPRKGWWGLPGSPDAPPQVDRQTTCKPPEPAAADQGCPWPSPAVIPPPVQAVVVSTAAVTCQPVVVDVVAESTPGTTTATCTSTVQPSEGGLAGNLVARVEERAAILEFDGGHDGEVADRLAREMLMGRDAAPPPAAATHNGVVAGFDPAVLAARAAPFPRQVLARFPGVVRLADDRADPSRGRRDLPTGPGTCRCGHDDWVQVPIHGGRSTRVDCRHCDRFGWFAVWHGQRMRGPDDAHQESGLAAERPPAVDPMQPPAGPGKSPQEVALAEKRPVIDRLSCAAGVADSLPAMPPVPSC